MTTERYAKESWAGGYSYRRIVFDTDGVASYPDGVPLANNYPDVMTPEYARSVFRAYGYYRDDGTETCAYCGVEKDWMNHHSFAADIGYCSEECLDAAEPGDDD